MREFWHSSEICQCDNNQGKASREYSVPHLPNKVTCYPHIQRVCDERAQEIWLASLVRTQLNALPKYANSKTRHSGHNFMLAKCPCITTPKVRSCVCEICSKLSFKLHGIAQAREAVRKALGHYVWETCVCLVCAQKRANVARHKEELAAHEAAKDAAAAGGGVNAALEVDQALFLLAIQAQFDLITRIGLEHELDHVLGEGAAAAAAAGAAAAER